jgi:hypothetical protein
MSDDETTAPAATEGEQGTSSPPKSTAAAAARRARRIGGPARPVDPPKAEPVSVTKAPAEPSVEPVTESELVAEPVPDESTTAIRYFPPPPQDEPADLVPAESPTAPAVVRWLPAGVLIVAAVTMAVLLATFSHSVWWAKPSAAAPPRVTPSASRSGPPPASTDAAANLLRQRVLAAAKQCVIATNKYDYQTIDADEAAGLKCTTGVQSTRYKTAMENLIRGPATKIKASQVPQINTAGIESVTANGRQWSIVVYGQLAIHNVNVKARTDPFAAVVRMDYVVGKWLMSDVATLAEPTG